MRLLKSWFAPELNGEIAPLSQHSSWKPINNLSKGPCQRSQHAVCSDGNFIYLHGGRGPHGSLSDLWRFNINKQTWTLFEVSGNASRPCYLEGHSLLHYDNNLFMFGGETSLASTDEVPLWKFDLLLHQWSKLKCNGCTPVGRREHVAVLYHENMLVHGGYIDLKGPSDELWKYDFVKNSWKLLKSCTDLSPSARYKHSGVMFKELLWISGGLMGVTDRNVNQVWIWNILYSHWSLVKIRGAPSQLFNHATCLIGNEVYIFGGNQKDGQATSKLWKSKIIETNGKYTQTWKLCQFPDKVFPSASCSYSLIAMSNCNKPNNFSSENLINACKHKNLNIDSKVNEKTPVVSSENIQPLLIDISADESSIINVKPVFNKNITTNPNYNNVKQDTLVMVSDFSKNHVVVSKRASVSEELGIVDENLIHLSRNLCIQGSEENLLKLPSVDDKTSCYKKKYYNYKGYVNNSYEHSPKYHEDEIIKQFSYNLSAADASCQPDNIKKAEYQTTSFIEISSQGLLKRGLDEKSLKVITSVSNPAVAFVKTNDNEQVLLPAALYKNADTLNELEETIYNSNQQNEFPKAEPKRRFETTLFLVSGSSQMFIPPLKEPLQMWTCKLMTC